MSSSPRLDLRPGVTEPVVLLISRREVDVGDIASVLSRLKVFLATREDAWRYRGQMDSIKLLLSCVAGSRFLGRGAVEMDADLVAGALARGFGGMNMVFDRFSFPEDDLEKMSNGLVEVLQQAGMA